MHAWTECLTGNCACECQQNIIILVHINNCILNNSDNNEDKSICIEYN